MYKKHFNKSLLFHLKNFKLFDLSSLFVVCKNITSTELIKKIIGFYSR